MGGSMERRIREQSLYERLKAARKTLGLGEEATMDEIKTAFRSLIRRWHPDKAVGNADGLHKEKSCEIIEAYKTVADYCKAYKISFSREAVSRYRPHEESWWEQFGHDPMWGG
jgi:DnaJ-class molecular chaperone